MIVTVTPNLALDITYTLDHLVVGAPMRVSDIRQRAGGKGVNVARVLAQLGVEVQAIALCGGNTGLTVAAELLDCGLPHLLVPIAGETRRAVAAVDRSTGGATVFNEVGPTVTGTEWAALEAAVARLLPLADVLVVSGSLPPGAPADGQARLVAAGRSGGVPVIVDATGQALLLAAAAGAQIVKPNETELLDATGSGDVLTGARVLLDLGAHAVVVSLGAVGAIAVTKDGGWRAPVPREVRGNATGAGDAMVAALALGLVRSWNWERRLREAVALSAAAVLHPQAGSFDAESYEAWRRLVAAERLSHPGM